MHAGGGLPSTTAAVPAAGAAADGVLSTVGVMLALAAIRLALASHIDLAPDEAYYWLWSRHPALSYYDHPPMIAWWIAASTALFGDGPAAIRLLPVLSLPAIGVLVLLTARELGASAATANRAALLVNAMLLFAIASVIATPDEPSALFWCAAQYALARVAAGRGSANLLWVGLFAGLGCISKYTDLFLGPGIVLALLADRDLRAEWRRPWLYLGGAAAGLVIAPVLWADALAGWASIGKQFGRMAVHGVEPRFVLEFLVAQFGLMNPLVAVLAAAGLWVGLARRDRAVRLLVLFNLPLVAYLGLHAVHGRVQGNWLAPAYPALALIATVGLDGVATARRWTRIAAGTGIVGAMLALAGLAGLSAVPVSVRTPADRLLGWSALAETVETAADRAGARAVLTLGYADTGELAWHLAGRHAVISITEPARYRFAGALATGEGPALVVLPDSPAGTAAAACLPGRIPAGAAARPRAGSAIRSYALYTLPPGPIAVAAVPDCATIRAVVGSSPT